MRGRSVIRSSAGMAMSSISSATSANGSTRAKGASGPTTRAERAVAAARRVTTNATGQAEEIEARRALRSVSGAVRISEGGRQRRARLRPVPLTPERELPCASDCAPHRAPLSCARFLPFALRWIFRPRAQLSARSARSCAWRRRKARSLRPTRKNPQKKVPLFGLAISKSRSETPLFELAISKSRSEVPLFGLAILESRSEVPAFGCRRRRTLITLRAARG